MGRADGGYVYEAEPGEIPELPPEPEAPGSVRVRQLRAELARHVATLEHNGLIDLPVEAVADALAQKAAIEYMIGETERRRFVVEEAARLRLEEEERQLSALRTAAESDPALRREIARRNDRDAWDKRWRKRLESYGPLPGGFADRLRLKL
jgi:hypothetical protein